MDRETLRGVQHLIVRDRLRSQLLQRIDPTVANTVGELLLLPPGHLVRKEVGAGLAHDLLLDHLARTHLGRGIQPHRHIQELLVQERHAALHTPGRQTLVRPQAIVEVQLGQLTHRLLVEFLGARRLVEIQVAAENLVGALAGEHHLDTHRLDHAGQQIHRRGGADRRHVVGLRKVDHVADRVQTLLDGIVNLMMDSTDVFRDHARLLQVRSALQADGERMEARPPGPRLRIVLDAHRAELLGNRRDHRRIQAAGQQHAVGNVGHQLALHRRLQRRAELRRVGRIVLDRVVGHPVAGVPALHARLLAPIAVAGKEGLVALALALQGLQLGSHVHLPVRIVADIQRDDPDRVPGDQEGVLLRVVEREGEDAAQLLQEIRSLVAVEREDDLAVAAGLEFILPGVAAADLLVVVYLAVHRQHLLPVRGNQRLAARLRVHDAQALVGQHGAAAAPDAAPVRSAMADLAAHLQGLATQGVGLLGDVEYSDYSTHNLVDLDPRSSRG